MNLGSKHKRTFTHHHHELISVAYSMLHMRLLFTKHEKYPDNHYELIADAAVDIYDEPPAGSCSRFSSKDSQRQPCETPLGHRCPPTFN